MKRGFVTNELPIVMALFAICLAVSLPFSRYLGWGAWGAVPLALVGFILVFCLLNLREIIDQLRARNRKRSPQRNAESADNNKPGDHNDQLASMDAQDVHKLVVDEIGNRWDESNAHAVNLATALVTPVRTPMIFRLVREGRTEDSIINVWIVLRELPEGAGFLIFYDDERKEFGLASKGFPDDPYPVICGYYGVLDHLQGYVTCVIRRVFRGATAGDSLEGSGWRA